MNYLLEDMEKWASRYDSDYFTRENLLNEAKKSAKVLKDRYKERDEYKTLYEKALKDTQEKSYDAWWDYKKEKSLEAAFKSTREERKKEAWDKTFGNNKPIIAEPIIAEPIVAKPIIAKPIVDPNIKPTQPTSGGNSSLKPLAIGAAGIGAAAGGAYLYNRYKKKKRAQAEQEKVAAPMFGKKRYIPRNTSSQMSRLYYENDLNRYKKFSNAPDFDESAFEKSQQAIDEYRPINLEENGKTVKNVFSSLIAADMARRGGMHLLSGNKPAAKRFGVAAGLASIYPAYRGVEGLKRRYHFSKEKNIEADKTEVAKDDAARSAYRDYLDKHNGGEGGWHSTGNTLSDASKHALLNEAKKKNARIQYNEDYSTNFISPKGKKSKRRWENARHLDEDDFDYNESNTDDPELLELIKMERAERKKGLKKTASLKNLSKKLYKSDSKLKDVAFGTYKKGPDKGANKFNVAYDKKRILNSWKNDVYKNDKTLDDKIERRHKEAYDDAFIEAAARPVALTVGAGAAIYGG